MTPGATVRRSRRASRRGSGAAAVTSMPVDGWLRGHAPTRRQSATRRALATRCRSGGETLHAQGVASSVPGLGASSTSTEASRTPAVRVHEQLTVARHRRPVAGRRRRPGRSPARRRRPPRRWRGRRPPSDAGPKRRADRPYAGRRSVEQDHLVAGRGMAQPPAGVDELARSPRAQRAPATWTTAARARWCSGLGVPVMNGSNASRIWSGSPETKWSSPSSSTSCAPGICAAM